MKTAGIAVIGASALILCFGAMAPTYAQKKEDGGAAPKQQARANNSSPRGQQVAASSRQTGRYANHGGRIPAASFSANFGSGHYFRINTPFVVGGYSRFQYGGFWFGMYDPWPVGWYDTDDVYVGYYDGGYYLYDREHPGARLSINVVL